MKAAGDWRAEPSPAWQRPDVPDAEDFPGSPCKDLRLAELPTEEFAGFVWVTMNPDAGTLREFLGPLCDEWAAYQIDEWQRVTALTANVVCNWKVIQDPFCESYHLPTVHPQLMETGPRRGHHHYDRLRDQQFTDAHHYNLFPSCSLTFNADGLLMQRMRPHATDPERCVFDHWYYAFSPAAEGATNIRVDGVDAEHQVFDYGDRRMGLIPDQDISITQGQQLGMRSRGFSRAVLSGQEARIGWFHHVINEYLDGSRPRPHPAANAANGSTPSTSSRPAKTSISSTKRATT